MGQLHRTELPELSRKLDNAFCMMPSYKNGAIYRDVRRALGHHLGGGVPRSGFNVTVYPMNRGLQVLARP